MTAVDLPDPIVVRRVVTVQAVFWGGYLLALVKLMFAGIRYGGFGFRPFGDDPTLFDPKEVFGGSVPEYLLQLPLDMIVLFGAIPGLGMFVAGLLQVLKLWPARAPRRWMVAVSTALTGAFLILHLTPFHSAMMKWMLD